MLTQEENALLTQVGPGTPMGELFRRYWMPAMLSEEIPGADSTPARVRILGEDLVAFRDSDGKPGIIDAYCPHRGAPLFFGRNEGCGLRCVYHGWKFDVTGKCVDLPNSPEGETYKDKVSITAYPAIDKGGVIWVYMGPKEHKPPFHHFQWLDLPLDHIFMQKTTLNCNYFQSMEGDLDASHAYFLHRTLDDQSANISARIRDDAATYFDPNPHYTLADTDYGLLMGASRKLADGNQFISVAHWMLPSYTTPGASPKVQQMNIRVPIDDENCYQYRLRYDLDQPLSAQELNEDKYGGFLFPELIPGTYLTVANKGNDYLVDRVAQKNYSYTGIKAFQIQDLALIEDQWGPISPRTEEHLVSADSAVIRVRQIIMKAARDLMEGTEPASANNPDAYRVLPTRMTLPGDADVEEALKPYSIPQA
ncbi:MAG: Rieske 2Fe-2S domain-containing protein [SAR202 cluster bacterium]|nr:Rieske 2Fe-2S domain-containing protein [SAR202 cluster bacterium]